ncbi:hypothetical protein [Oceanisphaera sp.]|uniref:hypothetical protein n=1 Tax=Oceanisphaera sp. TaxID=1929979 RepID=UPI003A930630
MIYLVPKQDITPVPQCVEVAPDRPTQKNDLRKLLFFALHEGLFQTFRKVFSRLDKQSIKDTKVVSARISNTNAISYDGGSTFYWSDVPQETWKNPFSYDSLACSKKDDMKVDYLQAKNSLYCVGYGNYVQTYTRYLQKVFKPRFFVDYSPEIIKSFDKSFEFSGHDFSVLSEYWAKDDKPIAVIASYHSDHVRQAHTLFKKNSGGFILVEKPPLVDYQDIQLYRELYYAGANIQIGFNRRYAPMVRMIKSNLTFEQPMMITISVNEVRISDTHWYHWPNQGTRITGNACHWIDLCQYFVQDKPIKLQLASSTLSQDDSVLLITYQNGSVAVITLTDKGNDLRGVQETVEVKQANVTYRLDDMIHLIVDTPNKGRLKTHKLIRDKGHRRMYQQFQKDILAGSISEQYPLEDLEVVTRVTYEFSTMLVENISEKKLEWDLNK